MVEYLPECVLTQLCTLNCKCKGGKSNVLPLSTRWPNGSSSPECTKGWHTSINLMSDSTSDSFDLSFIATLENDKISIKHSTYIVCNIMPLPIKHLSQWFLINDALIHNNPWKFYNDSLHLFNFYEET